MQGLPCESIPIGLKMTVPPHGFVRTPMVLSYHLINKCQELLNLDVVMEGSEAFMFSGYKQVLFISAILYFFFRFLMIRFHGVKQVGS